MSAAGGALSPQQPQEDSTGRNWVWTLRTKGGRPFWRVVASSEGGVLAVLKRAAAENKPLGLEYKVHASSFSLRWGFDQNGESAKQAVERASTAAAAVSTAAGSSLASSAARVIKSRHHTFRLNHHLERHYLRHAKWLALHKGLRRCLGHETAAYDHETPGHSCDTCMSAMQRNRK